LGSDSDGEDLDNGVKALILPPDGRVAVRCVIPEARGGRLKTGAILLDYSARHDIFEGFVGFNQLL